MSLNRLDDLRSGAANWTGYLDVTRFDKSGEMPPCGAKTGKEGIMRRERRLATAGTAIWHVVNRYAPFAIMRADENRIHSLASLQLFSEIGIEVAHEESRIFLKDAGPT